jgi:ribosome-associated protein
MMPAAGLPPAQTETATLSVSTETKKAARPAAKASPPAPPVLLDALYKVIDDAKAEDIVTLDLAGKTSLADAMIVASGGSARHVGAIAERVASSLKDMGLPTPRIEGMPVCDWVLIDASDVIIHLFRPEVRSFYNLEKLWGMGRPLEGAPPEPSAEKPKRVRKIATPAAGADDEKPKVRRAPVRKTAGSR